MPPALRYNLTHYAELQRLSITPRARTQRQGLATERVFFVDAGEEASAGTEPSPKRSTSLLAFRLGDDIHSSPVPFEGGPATLETTC